MAETKYGTLISNGYMNTYPPEKAPGAVMGGRLRVVIDTVEVTAGALATSKYYLGKLPSNAIVIPQLSKIHWDDLSAAGVPTLDIGLGEANGTAHDTALGNGNDVKTAAGSAAIGASNIADYGKEAWELCGLSADPGELFDVYATIQDAAADAGGTVTIVLVYAER